MTMMQGKAGNCNRERRGKAQPANKEGSYSLGPVIRVAAAAAASGGREGASVRSNYDGKRQQREVADTAARHLSS